MRAWSGGIVVIGGGVMGCGVAWRLAKAGLRVTLLERGRPGAEASSAAGGLLLPSAGREGGAPLLAHWLASLRMYPDLVAEITADTGVAVEYRVPGRLQIATTEEEFERLRQLCVLQQTAGVRAELCDAAAVRAAEPAVRPDVVGALFFPDHALVDNRRLTTTLALAASRRGAAVRAGCLATELLYQGERVIGVATADERIVADAVVIAAGTWSGLLASRFPLPVRPAKGQALALEAVPTPFQCILAFAQGALAARADGRIIFGSTHAVVGFDKRVLAGGVHALLSAALESCPALAGATVVETWAGLRPMTPDGMPIVGKMADGLYAITGHYQTGILGAAASTAALTELITTGSSSLPIEAFDPGRFMGGA